MVLVVDDLIDWYDEWETKPIIMCGGGDGFWGALFDLDTKSFSQLCVNPPM